MENYGALVGWVHNEAGDNIMLRLESVRSKSEADRRDPDILRVLMTRQQAAVLGNYLMGISGQSAPGERSRGWFRRLFG